MHASISDLTTYSRDATGDVPNPSIGSSTTVVGHNVYLFGGKSNISRKNYTADIYVFDLHSSVWEKIDPQSPEQLAPAPRYFHSADHWQGYLVIFGGIANNTTSEQGSQNVLCDVRFFSLQERRWLDPISSSDPTPSSSPDSSSALPSTPSSSSYMAPRARFAHLSAITSDKLFILGGQDMVNEWLDDIHVFDLWSKQWIAHVQYPRNCGTYRSAVVAPALVVRDPVAEGVPTKRPDNMLTGQKSTHPTSPMTDTSSIMAPHPLSANSDQLVLMPYSTEPTLEYPAHLYIYSNWNFVDVRRELETIDPIPTTPTIVNRSAFMTAQSSTQPPGLRFPTAHILGTHLIIGGTYLAQSYQSYSIWALNLHSMLWTRIDPGTALSTGSWSRGVLWGSTNRFVVFGNRRGNLVEDYNRRIVNWEHVAYVELESLGIYQPPVPRLVHSPSPALMSENGDYSRQSGSETGGGLGTGRLMGLDALDAELFADFEILCEDGRRIKCSRILLEDRWPWFKAQQQKYVEAAKKIVAAQSQRSDLEVDLPPLADLVKLSKDDVQGLAMDERPDPRLTPRLLRLSEPYPITRALLQYFYTFDLLTPLQHAPLVLSALLLLSSIYDLPHLGELVRHAMHRSLGPNTSVGVYDVTTLCDCQNLNIRALRIVMSSNKRAANRSIRPGAGGPGRTGGGGSSGTGGGRGHSSNGKPYGGGGGYDHRQSGNESSGTPPYFSASAPSRADASQVTTYPRSPTASSDAGFEPAQDAVDASVISNVLNPFTSNDWAIGSLSRSSTSSSGVSSSSRHHHYHHHQRQASSPRAIILPLRSNSTASLSASSRGQSPQRAEHLGLDTSKLPTPQTPSSSASTLPSPLTPSSPATTITPGGLPVVPFPIYDQLSPIASSNFGPALASSDESGISHSISGATQTQLVSTSTTSPSDPRPSSILRGRSIQRKVIRREASNSGSGNGAENPSSTYFGQGRRSTRIQGNREGSSTPTLRETIPPLDISPPLSEILSHHDGFAAFASETSSSSHLIQLDSAILLAARSPRASISKPGMDPSRMGFGRQIQRTAAYSTSSPSPPLTPGSQTSSSLSSPTHTTTALAPVKERPNIESNPYLNTGMSSAFFMSPGLPSLSFPKLRRKRGENAQPQQAAPPPISYTQQVDQDKSAHADRRRSLSDAGPLRKFRQTSSSETSAESTSTVGFTSVETSLDPPGLDPMYRRGSDSAGSTFSGNGQRSHKSSALQPPPLRARRISQEVFLAAARGGRRPVDIRSDFSSSAEDSSRPHTPSPNDTRKNAWQRLFANTAPPAGGASVFFAPPPKVKSKKSGLLSTSINTPPAISEKTSELLHFFAGA